MLAVVLGLLFSAAGVLGIVRWWNDFLIAVRGLLPAIFLGGGLLAILAGVTSIMDDLRAKKEEASKSKNETK